MRTLSTPALRVAVFALLALASFAIIGIARGDTPQQDHQKHYYPLIGQPVIFVYGKDKTITRIEVAGKPTTEQVECHKAALAAVEPRVAKGENVLGTCLEVPDERNEIHPGDTST